MHTPHICPSLQFTPPFCLAHQSFNCTIGTHLRIAQSRYYPPSAAPTCLYLPLCSLAHQSFNYTIGTHLPHNQKTTLPTAPPTLSSPSIYSYHLITPPTYSFPLSAPPTLPTSSRRLMMRLVCPLSSWYAVQQRSVKCWKLAPLSPPPLMTKAMSGVNTNGARSLEIGRRGDGRRGEEGGGKEWRGEG